MELGKYSLFKEDYRVTTCDLLAFFPFYCAWNILV